MLLERLLLSTENDYIDFKREWYSGPEATFDLFHDILSMCNSLTDSVERYIVIGVNENKKTQEKTFFDVSSDKNSRSAETIINQLRDYMPVPPNIEVIRENIGDKAIDIIKIIPFPREIPYTLRRSYYCQVDGKKHTLPKDWIYSRDGSRNTGINELCHKSVLEELFARKRGEHLPIQERFSFYLDDFKNWKRPKTDGVFTSDDLSVDNYFYKSNYKFKILRHDADDIFRKIQKKEDVGCYNHLASDTGICEDYWNYRLKNKACYDDYYYWFDIELWVENTLIETLQIMGLHFKYYFHDQGIHLPTYFYLPPRDYLVLSGLKSKENAKKSFIWKVCKMLTYKECIPDAYYEDLDNLLDFMNWEYIDNFQQYEKMNQEYLYKKIDS